MTKPIFIIRGYGWTRQSGGQRCIHILCEKLMELGERAYLTSCKLREGSPVRLFSPAMLDNSPVVLIEPEIIGESPDWPDLTVRWLLNTPGKTGDDLSWTWGKDDLLAHFDVRYSRPGSIPLCVPHVDRSIFNNENNPLDANRDIDCFYARKATYFGCQKMIPPKAIDVSPDGGRVGPGDWETLAKMFRHTRTFYTMEDTATSIEAALCGAKVVYVYNDYQPEPPDIEDFAVWYADLERRSKVEVRDFVEACYKRLGLPVIEPVLT